MAHVFKLNGDYEYSVTEIEQIEELAKEVVIEEVTERIHEVLGDEVRIDVSWIYGGYRLFIYKVLTENQVNELVDQLDPIKKIGLCSLFWDRHKQEDYTGILLAYDLRHYYRFLCENNSFIVLCIKGLEEFVEKLNLKMTFINPELDFLAEKDLGFERRMRIEKIKGITYEAKVEVKGNHGRMHILNRDRQIGFDNYWDKKTK